MRTLRFEMIELKIDLEHEESLYFGRMYRTWRSSRMTFVCKRSSLEVCGDFGTDKRGSTGRVEKKMVRAQGRGENRVTFDLEGNLRFSISNEWCRSLARSIGQRLSTRSIWNSRRSGRVTMISILARDTPAREERAVSLAIPARYSTSTLSAKSFKKLFEKIAI